MNKTNINEYKIYMSIMYVILLYLYNLLNMPLKINEISHEGFERIIHATNENTKLNDKMYTTSELYSILAPFDDLRCHKNANTAIETLIQTANSNNLLVVAGSHYWGKRIERNFKFFLVNNVIKS